MITIRYAKHNSKVEQWKEKLEELVVAHKWIEDHAVDEPRLQDKEVEVLGEEAIQIFINQLEQDIIDWRKPGCGI